MDKKITLADLATLFAQKAQLPADSADAFCRAFFAVIQEGLSRDKFVKIRGFGTFKTVTVSERESMNIHTGERTVIGEHNKVNFTPDAALKALINRPFAHFQTVVIEEGVSVEELNSVTDEEYADDLTTEEMADAETDLEEAEVQTTPTVSETMVETEVTADNPHSQPAEQEPTQDKAAQTDENTETSTTPEAPEAAEADLTDHDKPAKDETPAGAAEEGSPTDAETEAVPAASDAILFTADEEEQADDNILSTDNQAEDSADATDAEVPEEEADTAPHKPVADDETVCKDGTSPCSVSGQQVAATDVQYVVVPPPHRGINWWKTLALLLFLLLLMTLSYFAGYYKVFCPPCGPIQNPTPVASAPVCPMDTTAQRTDSVCPATQPADSLTPSPTAPKAEEKQKQPATEQPATHLQDAPTDSVRYHVVQPGETLYAIARRYYGDKRAARHIIEANHIPDSDCITVGQKLRLPPAPTRTN